jgi:tetratricopeptide (TPR) repeat protein
MVLRFRLVLLLIFCIAGTKALPTAIAQSSAAGAVAPEIAGSARSEPATFAHAERLVQNGQLTDALKELDTLAAQQPEPAGVERLRGTALYMQGDMQGADAAFARALQQNPTDHEASEMRGVALFRLGKAAQAVPLLEAGKGAATGANVEGNYVLALCYMDTRQYDKARTALAAQYGFSPDAAEGYLLAARLFFRREYTPAAEEAVRKAVALAPGLPLAHDLLGEIALSKGELPGAVAEFEKERTINPLYGGIYDRLGDTYTRMGDYPRAQQALNRALLLEPNASGPFILLGKVLLKQRNAAMASLYLERAVHMDPGNYMAHSLLGQAYRAGGRAADAQRESAMGEKIQNAATPKFEKP